MYSVSLSLLIWRPKNRHKAQDTRHKTPDTRHKTQDTRHKTQEREGTKVVFDGVEGEKT